MSTPPRRRSRRLATASGSTAAPSPSTPPPARLLDLPTDLLERALSRCDSPAEIARFAAVSLLFHASLAAEAIRLWAQERGFELPAQPEDEDCAVRWLCFAALLSESNTPTRLPSPLGGERAVSVSAGGYHSIALTGSGAIWSWGSAGDGQLGHGDEQTQLLPKKIVAFAGQRVVAVSAGQRHSLAITADGNVWSCGYGGSGKLGHGDQEKQLLPKKIEALAGRRIVAVSAGENHSLALTADGAVWSWGWGGDGRLGHGDERNQPLPKKIEALAGRRVVAVSAAYFHSLALAADGNLWSWGNGGWGQLGHGDRQTQRLPKKIEAFAGKRVVAVSAGANHNLARTDGAVFTWGEGGHGCLGHGEDLSNQLLPKRVEVWVQ